MARHGNIGPRNPWLVVIGLFLIYTGFWGFYAACNVPIYDAGGDYGGGTAYFTATTIYLTPTTLSGITANFLMSLAGGLLMGYWVSKGDPFWTYSSGLAGIITASARERSLSPAAGHDHWCDWRFHHVQNALLGRAALLRSTMRLARWPCMAMPV
ncbi:MAG: hypothetical protein CM1200mP41_10240 [Gammaproteobacteria bacterium]|nr:MAG: hypothetical protein CM1200mP41_10240 [Gammaproteobacteria bacterium]